MFAADIRHWPTVESFAASLTGNAPRWAQGVTPHHTDIPRVNQWRGLASMVGLREFYIGKGWGAGPHLFLCVGASDSAHDGIWQLTPLALPGVHAGACNDDHWGMEIVGNYNAAPWSRPLAELVSGVTLALLRWRGLDVTTETVKGHRECMANRDCPGRAIDLDTFRAELARRLAPAPPAAATITADSPIIAPARCTQAQAAAFILSRPHPHYTSADIRLSILPAYFEVCARVGVDPCVALAQLVHETGNLSSFWSSRPQRNPAGIGVTGQTSKSKPATGTSWAWDGGRRLWAYGLSFPSWASHAIPAHVGRLVAYAVPLFQRTPAQQALVEQALAYRPLPATVAGVAPTLRGLDGRWAMPGQGYGAKLATIADAIRRTTP